MSAAESVNIKSRTFGAVAEIIADNGYQPVPVHFRQKNPVPTGWQGYVFDPSDLTEKRYQDQGIGILTKATPAADIDVRDPRLAEQLQALAVEMLGAAPRRIGLEPKSLLVYRLEGEPFAKIQTKGYALPGDAPDAKAHKVEVLADGQQFVAFNIHMDTGKPYTWNGTGDPLTVPVADLPPITRQRAQAFVDACEAILAENGKPSGKIRQADAARPHSPNEQQLAKDPAVCRAAIAAIPNEDLDYDDWIYVGLGIKGALGEDGSDAFDTWSKKSKKYNADATKKEWRGFRPTRIGAGALYHLAAQVGWKRPDDPTSPFPIELVTSAEEFIALPLPEREPIIAGFLYKQSIAEIVGWRGCGKTWFGLSLAKAIAEASPFLGWAVPQKRRVLYVDGEMAGRELQDRMRAIFGPVVPELFELMASEIFYQKTDATLAINEPPQQERFEGLLKALAAAERNPEVILFDNLSALTMGMDENSSSEFQPLKAWFTRLRHMGYTVIFVHHSGKGGDQRGTSGREDNLDMTVELSEPEQRTDVTRIEMEIGKCRGVRPQPDRAQIALVRDQAGTLELAVSTEKARRQPGDIQQKYWILKFIASGTDVKRKHIAEEFEIGIAAAKEHVAKLIKERLVSGAAGPLDVTPEGRSKIGYLWPDEDREM